MMFPVGFCTLRNGKLAQPYLNELATVMGAPSSKFQSKADGTGVLYYPYK
jgi:hypothetical protein